MRFRSICELVKGTADAAFATDSAGHVVAWNGPAEALVGVSSNEALGQPCHQIVKGMDECGMVCSENCAIKQAASKRHPVHHFDLRVETPEGKRWCNMSVIIAYENGSREPFTIHILRLIDVRKRLELMVRDFLVTEVKLPQDEAVSLIHQSHSALSETELTLREREILKLVGVGKTTRTIAESLHISPNTVDNHIQHILKKLNAHSRLEAVRRAELSGLI